MASERPPGRRRTNPFGLMVIGSEMASFTIVGLVIDLLAGTMPWFTIGLTLLGFLAAFMHLVRMANAMGRSADGDGNPK